MAQLMLRPLTVSRFSKIQIGFTFLVPAYPGSSGKRPLNGCVCVCVLDSQQYYAQEGRHGYGSRMSKGPSTVHKIREALNLMRNQKFEVLMSSTVCNWY